MGAAVTDSGKPRDQIIIVLMLHTEQVHLEKRSGIIQVYGKRNKYREVPLNATAKFVLVLEKYIKTQTQNDEQFHS